ncbi:TadE family type IV pilus minor pilin [Ornithinimicrobium tianjinense]|uniref:TadE-like protein n=2 Tax=Ornithinimicrobium tianjinense TaxID=1195761 RepID=A0A917BD04_9MICO|nr:hypothetical protein GCM10011366_01270 [Ornithinimicrobium tianjinense]
MTTAELALATPAVVLVLALCLSGMTFALDQLRCEDAARVAARAASRGEQADAVRALAETRLPEGARISVEREDDLVRVEVLGPRRARTLPGLPAAQAEAVAQLEPGARP